ncbi:Mitochondrial carnitine carrier [Sparassis crispa]|uniref:Mitochondrial carnitine carrier n=1 Tax=Sparassis crispa TaxID=139825 RepID=A0A401H4V6_9APHY|nr:Mitochondrial carnitine carrier [Sparassis crispa]GBE89433.1 Mitochondrial carnitine carrier [Sparassis crispa]
MRSMDIDKEDSSKKANLEIDPVVDFFAGTVAGMTALAVGFPFDTVKVRFQNPEIAQKYRSTFHALFTIVRTERVSGVFRGIASPLLTSAPLNGLVFSSYRFLMKSQLSDENATPTLTQINIAGAGSGVIASLITTPTELIKVHQQSMVVFTSSSAIHKPPTTFNVARLIFKHHGIRGLYRGITATALRDTGYGVYFVAYEATLRYCAPPPPSHDHSSLISEADSSIASHSWPAMLLAGGVAGVAGWLVTFLFDVIKTGIQSIYSTGPENPYRNIRSTCAASYRSEGLSVFFRGLAPTLIRLEFYGSPCSSLSYELSYLPN